MSVGGEAARGGWSARWTAYWFTPAPLLDLAICRVAVCGMWLVMMVFPYALLTVPPYEIFASQLKLPAEQYDPLPVFRLLTLPMGWDYRPTLAHLETVHALSIAAAACGLLGLFSRLSLAVVGAGTLFMVGHSFSYGDHHHIETVPLLLTGLLALSPCGHVLSLDAWWRRRRGLDTDDRPLHARRHAEARWPRLAMAWLLSIIYLSAALNKLGAGGIDWLNGYTLQHYIVRDALYWGSDLGLAVAPHFGFIVFLSWVTIVFEGGFFTVLIWPRLGPLLAITGAAFHLGIFFSMRAPFAAYLPAFVALVPWSEWIGRWRARRGGSPTGAPGAT